MSRINSAVRASGLAAESERDAGRSTNMCSRSVRCIGSGRRGPSSIAALCRHGATVSWRTVSAEARHRSAGVPWQRHYWLDRAQTTPAASHVSATRGSVIASERRAVSRCLSVVHGRCSQRHRFDTGDVVRQPRRHGHDRVLRPVGQRLRWKTWHSRACVARSDRQWLCKPC